MQHVRVEIYVEYRSDGKVNKTSVVDAIKDVLLSSDRDRLFGNGATYAGYSVSLPSVKPALERS